MIKRQKDDQIHDEYRIHYLEEHLKELGKAIEEGCEVLGILYMVIHRSFKLVKWLSETLWFRICRP